MIYIRQCSTRTETIEWSLQCQWSSLDVCWQNRLIPKQNKTKQHKTQQQQQQQRTKQVAGFRYVLYRRQISSSGLRLHGPLTRYVKLRVVHAPGMPGIFSPPPTSKEIASDLGMHHGTCVTHVPWSMSESLTRGGGENVPGIPGACAIRNFTYLTRGSSLPQAIFANVNGAISKLWLKIADVFIFQNTALLSSHGHISENSWPRWSLKKSIFLKTHANSQIYNLNL